MEKELLEHLKNKIEMVNHPEQVNHPSHYQFGNDKTYEVIKIIEIYGFDFHLGNCFKYISRAGKKNPEKEIEDLKKARFYLDRKIEFLENNKL